MAIFKSLLIALATTCLAFKDHSNWHRYEIGASIQTTSGLIMGHAAANATQVSEYLGIPFARPPLGNLRFAPPSAYYDPASLLNASKFGADCPASPPMVPSAFPLQLRSLLGDLSQSNDTLDEDCLFLNIWTKPQSGSRHKPVLVWIYGGGFNYGGTNVRVYNGQYFADTEDVVLVSINYRTNIFGFPGAPGQAQNVGLLDQRLAIEWIRDNICGFGGDPDRVTLFGQSAGGASVDMYSYAWTEDPIVAGTIIQSGSATAFGNRRASSAEQSWFSVAEKLGCGTNVTHDSDAVLACMRQPNMTWQSIEAASTSGNGLTSLVGKFGPTIDNKTVFENYTERALAGNYIKKPTMTGSCNYEAGLFILIAAGAGQTLSPSAWEAFDQNIFTCPVATVAQYRSDQNVPVWRYYYSGMYPNILIPTVNISQAYHTAELPILFGTSQEASKTDSSWQERSLGDYMRGAWAAFAASPRHGLEQLYGWPTYNAKNQSLVLLGQDNQTVASYSGVDEVDKGCPFPFLGATNL